MDLSSFTLGLAAGVVKGDTPQFDDVCRSPIVTDITVGSYCLHERTGNRGVTYYYDSETGTSYNSMGLPCKSAQQVSTILPHMRQKAHGAEVPKKLWASIAPFSTIDTGSLYMRFAPLVDGIEFNASCPNVWGNNKQKPIPSLEPELFGEHLEALRVVFNIHRVPIRVKVSPMEDGLAKEIALCIEKAGFIKAVVACNTVPNQRPTLHNGTDALGFTEPTGTELKHVGGMGGRGAKPYALKTVAALRSALPDSVKIIGCGGIMEGADLYDYANAGATGAQVCTAFMESRTGAGVFSSIMEGAVSLQHD